MRGSRKAASVALAFVVAALLAACGSSDDKSSSSEASAGSATTTAAKPSKPCRIGLSNGVSDAVEQSYLAGIARKHPGEVGCKLVLGTASGDPAKQFNEVQQWIQAKQVDAIVLLPTGGNPAPLMSQAKAAGIPVIGYAGPIPGGSGAINYDQQGSGKQLASAAIAWAKQNFPGDKIKDFSYGIFTFDACGKPCKDRTDPVMAAIQKELGVKPVSNQTAFTEDVGLKAAQNMLSAHPNLSMILGIGDGAVLGAMKAVQSAGRADKMFLGGMNGDPTALKTIAAGGPYKATAALKFTDIGRAVIDVPATLLKTGTAPDVTLKSALVDSPEKAKELLKTYSSISGSGS